MTSPSAGDRLWALYDGPPSLCWRSSGQINRIEFEVPQAALTYRYVVDDADNLTEIHLTDGSNPEILLEAITVDADGNMLTRTDQVTTEVISYGWDGWDLVKEIKTTGAVIETTNYLVPQGEVHAFQRDGDWFYLHGDALSSTQLVTDENGDVVGRFIFGAWGEELSATETIPGLFDNRFVGGLGCRRDSATNLIYMRHRWYDSQLQRFISRDPLGFEEDFYSKVHPQKAPMISAMRLQESNLHLYASNAPVDFVDPDGLISIPPGTPTAPTPQPPSPTDPGPICMNNFTNKACKAACDAVAGSAKARTVCYQVCTTLKGKTCNQLFSYCMHLSRHRGEVGKKDDVLCMQVYNSLC